MNAHADAPSMPLQIALPTAEIADILVALGHAERAHCRAGDAAKASGCEFEARTDYELARQAREAADAIKAAFLGA